MGDVQMLFPMEPKEFWQKLKTINGNKIGISIKASSIDGKPILSLLESKYEANKQVRQAYKVILKTTIDKVLANHPDKQNFIRDLSSQGINVVCRTNEQGFLYGITYV